MKPLRVLPCEDEVLLVRPVTGADEADLFALYGDPEVMAFASDPVFRDIEDVRRTIASIQRNIDTGEALELGIVLKSAGQLIGLCDLHNIGRNSAEVGYMLNRAYWGRGMMHRALKNFLAAYPAALDLTSITANVDRANGRSIRTLTSLGFGLLREEGEDRIYVLRTTS